ncbi:DUF3489 domain-containing protein, partial [Pseudoruegeria sp. M32A2M]|nr:DUF3489 domain-containing protein [Pseudoruegeria sp. M32A2M]
RRSSEPELASSMPSAPRAGTKQVRLIEMLSDPDGATIVEISKATGWQAHTVRGTISGTLRKKLGLTVICERTADRGRVYRVQTG